ncbi:MAG: ImmA/IrrE family metallo-endopeptidase [Agathobaculum butyriciproducens]|nr:ImmA/IrrE family metallo-endopeptidase [Agathobaculum butyriciproducens]
MISKERRQQIYTTVFQFIIDHNICTLPIDIYQIADILHVPLTSLSQIVQESDLSKEDVLCIWKNEDGCVHSYTDKDGRTKYRIAYNDEKPKGRMRFTIAEELSHIMLGHTNLEEFNMFHQSYSEAKYQMIDEEARIAAGILLCSPKFYYEQGFIYDVSELALAYSITEACAKTRISVFDKWETEITENPLYCQIPMPIISSQLA